MQTIVVNDAGRLKIIDMVLAQLATSGDPRAPEAIAEYERQRAEVVQRMARAGDQAPSNLPLETAPDGQPRAQVVGMQSLSLRAN